TLLRPPVESTESGPRCSCAFNQETHTHTNTHTHTHTHTYTHTNAPEYPISLGFIGKVQRPEPPLFEFLHARARGEIRANFSIPACEPNPWKRTGWNGVEHKPNATQMHPKVASDF